MSRAAVAVGAGVLLVALDICIIAISFLYRPAQGNWFALAVVLGFVVALALCLPALLFVIQNIVTLPFLYAAVTHPADVTVGTILLLFAFFLMGNGLAWLVGRGLPQRPWFGPSDQPR